MTTDYHTYYESPIGLIRIGGTETYISEVSFIDDKSQVQYGEPGISDVIHQCTEQLIEFFQGKRKVFNIPIHQDGTDFQKRVWGKLTEINYGKTISYLDLAKQLGSYETFEGSSWSKGILHIDNYREHLKSRGVPTRGSTNRRAPDTPPPSGHCARRQSQSRRK